MNAYQHFFKSKQKSTVYKAGWQTLLVGAAWRLSKKVRLKGYSNATVIFLNSKNSRMFSLETRLIV